MDTLILVAIIASITSIAVAIVSALVAYHSSSKTNQANIELEKYRYQLDQRRKRENLEVDELTRRAEQLQKLGSTLQSIRDDIRLIARNDPLVEDAIVEFRTNARMLMHFYSIQYHSFNHLQRKILHNARDLLGTYASRPQHLRDPQVLEQILLSATILQEYYNQEYINTKNLLLDEDKLDRLELPDKVNQKQLLSQIVDTLKSIKPAGIPEFTESLREAPDLKVLSTMQRCPWRLSFLNSKYSFILDLEQETKLLDCIRTLVSYRHWAFDEHSFNSYFHEAESFEMYFGNELKMLASKKNRNIDKTKGKSKDENSIP